MNYSERNEPNLSLLRNTPWEGLPLKSGMIAIGGDGCFGYILMSLNRQDYGSIHFCCTWSEDGVTDIYDSMGFWRIADSFSDFLSHLEPTPKDEWEPPIGSAG